jgi:hypothetical protein
MPPTLSARGFDANISAQLPQAHRQALALRALLRDDLLAARACCFHRSLDAPINSGIAKDASNVRNGDLAAHAASDGFQPESFCRVKPDDFVATLRTDLLALHSPARASIRRPSRRFCAVADDNSAGVAVGTDATIGERLF